MRSRCHTCSHPKRAEIDEDLLAGRTSHALSEKYGLPASTIQNHRRAHVDSGSRARRGIVEPGLENLADLLGNRIKTAVKSRRYRDVAQLGREMRRLLEDRHAAELAAEDQTGPRNPFRTKIIKAVMSELFALARREFPAELPILERLLGEYTAKPPVIEQGSRWWHQTKGK